MELCEVVLRVGRVELLFLHYEAYPRKMVTIQQGVPRGLAGPLAGCGVSPPFSLTPPPEAVQEKGDLHSYEK